ncbi:hypothetical protein ANO14919_121520 [Xylariales sp. No.14919]|nr:hypothetical protein ANO14919_121520 [Xylariales sp. No.14919]
MGRYKRGPYVRSDWRNPNHTYKGINPVTHPFYHLMEASIGKDVFYDNYLTARATPFGDRCMLEELVHGVRAVEASVDWTMRIFFTIQHYLHRIGVEVQDGCIMLDSTGRTMWSEMVAPYETYGLHVREMLADETFTLTPRYRVLYERLAAHDRSCLRSVSADEGASERLLALTQGHVWQLTAAVPPHNAYEEAGGTVRLVNTYRRRVGLPPAQVSALIDADADAVLARAATPPGYKAIGVVSKPTRADYGGACVHGATIPC